MLTSDSYRHLREGPTSALIHTLTTNIRAAGRGGADSYSASNACSITIRSCEKEILVSARERRRRWSVEEKLRILGQCAAPGATPYLVCREHGIGTGQLYTWRKQFRSGELTGTRRFHC